MVASSNCPDDSVGAGGVAGAGGEKGVGSETSASSEGGKEGGGGEAGEAGEECMESEAGSSAESLESTLLKSVSKLVEVVIWVRSIVRQRLS